VGTGAAQRIAAWGRTLSLKGLLTPASGDWLFHRQASRPETVAVVRIVVFGLIAARVDVSRLRWFATLPDELVFPPVGSSALLTLIPVTETSITVAAIALIAMALLAAVGWFTRVTAAATVLLGLFVMLVPQMYAKSDHYHHLFWFAAVLAVSPCADALSVDAWLTPSKENRRISAEPRYYWPLAAIWLLMGILYFFPGFWKLVLAGEEWLVGDGLRVQMYTKWYQLGGWTPAFRLDQYPMLYRAAAGYVIAFELGFLGLILHRNTRPFAAMAGSVFHVAAGLTMKVWFVPLLLCYVAFIDWGWIVDRAKGSADDGGHPGSDSRPGKLCAEIPVSLLLVLSFLLGGNVLFGAKKIVHGWPFAAYPDFVPAPEHASVIRLQMVVTGADVGQEVRVSIEEFGQRLGPSRHHNLQQDLLNTRPDSARRRRMRVYSNVALNSKCLPERGVLHVYRVRVSTRPEEHGRVIEKRRLYAWPVSSVVAGAR
jgi:hypothetical protein